MENMKRTTIIGIVFLLTLSSYAAVGIKQNSTINDQTTMTLHFSEPALVERNEYVQFDVDGANAVTYHAGKPVLPVYRTKLTFPFGTKILNIDCESSDIGTMGLSQKVQPAPRPVIAGTETSEQHVSMDESIYFSTSLYPENWCTYYTGGGLDENSEHKTFVIVEVYPVRYAPASDTIHYVTNLDVTITYRESPGMPLQTDEDFKLVIIAPSAFSSELTTLVTHKKEKGLTTLLKTTEDIYKEFTGVDKPEQIKYFIKYAIENYSTQYVLLVGGLKSVIYGKPRDDRNQGTKHWYVPVRYTNLKDDPPTFDPGFLSDLYYADIYDSEGNFSSWNTNGNDIFAEWYGLTKDKLDLYPDVYVGRLPCRNKAEVRIMVKKIIAYEKEPAGDWYNTIIAVAGDSHGDPLNYNEGEIVTEKIINEPMSNYTAVKLYSSNQDTDPTFTPVKDNIVRVISEGGGHLVFDGHGNPFSWNTHWPKYGGWTGGIQVNSFPKLKNREKLPVCVIGGCHNSQFNVSIIYCLLDDRNNTRSSWCYGVPVPECFGWWIVRKIGGGAIASIGNTGLGYGYVGGDEDLNGDGIAEPVCIEGLGGYLQVLFYKTIDEDTDMLGHAHSGAISKYLDVFPPMTDRIDTKTVQQWALIGDPSLKMGGYGTI